MNDDSKLLQACALWAKNSKAGLAYMVGRLGGLRVLVMENRDRQGERDPSHVLLIGPAPARREEAP